ncbi:TFIID, TFIIF, Ino80, SWI/SNF, and NuA4 complex YEATS family subunit Tfg3 [Schizosaccharomyces pombe]|uniref:Transcription initiation factor TFIID subunit 14 n=1 Tax=Schizosaccharomyces pombe (strain 972 / ATCC 24843) TaxID=284812 RepID=TAF14_SCHPO|nr:transcription factor TFIIF complex subunit Tfg3 [Schizosaccharomyces pombe]O94436.1 RecName: Full=Transcription initiation factor TFIID subunit 14; AltName: Full=SWI/SNF chromatin-remodeling complex subunit tfg3; AltName: Full=SWI/SNF complex subunit tfg3; AltName: Full=TBP-associated factor 14; AltName: Full=TBP-associated factor 30 kDa; AltName: Full=Transcription factor G 30 kDa subunit; AltName: Full=Transcription initiation factor TFIIF 30 kDa subunit [Schizosaccharomyces pombe 972h-]CAA2|eukprot:NP_593114.1 transcription factor TFIIF complex subunit Tfg3 [Schizosaccharomyces pombe]
MTTVKRTVRLITDQNVLPGGEAAVLNDQSFPVREWSIKLVCLNPQGEETDASFVDRVTYKLHPTFQNPTRTIRKPPFQIKEQGWGEFEMEIIIYYADKGGEHRFLHYLHFQQEHYHEDIELNINATRPGLLKALTATGEVPGYSDEGEEARKDKRKNESEVGAGKKKAKAKPVDMDKLAEGLQKLQEDDLLQVVQMVNENKTPDMYVRNDIEGGEFHIDLYTLPDNLLLLLYSFCAKRVTM